MTEDPKKKLEEARKQIDLGLGGVFSELGAALTDLLQRIDSEGSGEIRREHEFKTPNGPVRAQTGIRIRTLGGPPATQSSRNPAEPVNQQARASTKKPEPKHTKIPSVRPIAAEILDDGKVWVLTADLPGAVEENLVLGESDGSLVIEALGNGRKYADTVPLPEDVAFSDIQSSLQNGILVLRATRPGGYAP
ncbi:MAG: Hsp20/alpha crystallin family protein [Pseudomonadota bacterium]